MPFNPNSEIYQKLYKFCAYEERNKQQVLTKLKRLNVNEVEQEQYLNMLIEDDLLNEERYLSVYIQVKIFRKQWGKRKVQYQLMQKGFGKGTILEALKQIEDKKYEEIAQILYNNKYSLSTKNLSIKEKKKRYDFMAQRGFEPYIIHELLNKFE